MALADAPVPVNINNSLFYYGLNFTYLWFGCEVLNIDAFFISVPNWVEIAIYTLDAQVFVGGVYSILDRCWSIVAVEAVNEVLKVGQGLVDYLFLAVLVGVDVCAVV